MPTFDIGPNHHIQDLISGDPQQLHCREVAGLIPEGELWTDWEALLDRVAPEQRLFGPGWYYFWNQTWGDQHEWVDDFRYITVRDGEGRLCGVMPFGARRCGPFRARTLTGYPQPARAVLAEVGREREVGQVIADYIARCGWHCLQLGPVRDNHPAARSLVEALRGKMALYVLRQNRLAILHTPPTWDEYRRGVLGGKFFRKLGYYERRTSRAGGVRIIHYRHPSEEEIPLIIRDLSAIESASWLVRSGDPRFIGPHAQSLWIRLVTEHLVPNDYFDCWIMYLDRKPVSFCLALTIDSYRYVIANNFDESCKDHRTGSTLYRHMMEEGFERGVCTVDFGHGDLRYKGYWGAGVEGGWATYLVFPRSLAGRLVRMVFALGHGIFGSAALRTLRDRLL